MYNIVKTNEFNEFDNLIRSYNEKSAVFSGFYYP